MDTFSALVALDRELGKIGLTRSLYICGGAALVLLKITTRSTMDVDVLKPQVDKDLSHAVKTVALELGLSDNWLNNGPSDLLEYLDDDWHDKCSLVFNGAFLNVFAISRLDLIKSKLWAACDRMDDIPDLIELSPSAEELDLARTWVLGVDGSEIWPRLVDGCIKELERRKING